MQVSLMKFLGWMGLRDLPVQTGEEYRTGEAAKETYPVGQAPDGGKRSIILQVCGPKFSILSVKFAEFSGHPQFSDYGIEARFLPQGVKSPDVLIDRVYFRPDGDDLESSIFDTKEIEAGPNLTEAHVRALCHAFGRAIKTGHAIGTPENPLSMEPPKVPENVILFTPRVRARSFCRG